ncbi:MAG: hypothetical protein KAH84_12855 [Thiomargarita sp.]|nr:hypothetical protein [Thiomargarita sp.]
MTNRRKFIKTTLAVASGIAVGQATTVFADEDSSSGVSSLPNGIVYTEANPGKWAKKVGGHLPQVQVVDNKVSITTNHSMSEAHYIVRHTLVMEDGTVIGEKTFSPGDENAISNFDLPEGHSSKLYATSFCNKHDLWMAEFSV